MATIHTVQDAASAYPGLPRTVGIPSHIVDSGKISDTALAVECYAYQRFSCKLQAYLIDYVNKIYSEAPILG